jgi:hypothetical protein
MHASLAIWLSISCLAVSADFLSDDFQLCLPSTGHVNFSKVSNLVLRAGAEDVLDKPARFPNLHSVVLESETTNSSYIERLSENYSNISNITITQNDSLDDESISRLAKFTRLKSLGLECPVKRPDLLALSLPKCTNRLWLARSNNFSGFAFPEELKFPNIETLEICGSTLYPSFFKSCKFSNLKRLKLQNVSLVSGSLSACSELSKLKEVDVYISRKLIKPSDTFESEFLALRRKNVRVRIRNGT